jgi:hypothetical protein
MNGDITLIIFMPWVTQQQGMPLCKKHSVKPVICLLKNQNTSHKICKSFWLFFDHKNVKIRWNWGRSLMRFFRVDRFDNKMPAFLWQQNAGILVRTKCRHSCEGDCECFSNEKKKRRKQTKNLNLQKESTIFFFFLPSLETHFCKCPLWKQRKDKSKFCLTNW